MNHLLKPLAVSHCPPSTARCPLHNFRHLQFATEILQIGPLSLWERARVRAACQKCLTLLISLFQALTSCPSPFGRGELKFKICKTPVAIYILQFAILWLIFSVTALSAQVVRLPAVIPEDQKYPGLLVSAPDSSAEILQAPGGTIADVPAESPRTDVRPGMFQKLIFNATWLARGAGSRGFGQNDLESKIILALPCPTRDQPLVITPGFTLHYLDGPAGVDLPPQLYDAYMQFRWLSQITPRWGLDLAITPGVFSDFNQSSNDALRLTGHGAAAWTCNPDTKFVLGAAYLDRPDVNVIPVGGIIWTPNDDVKLDLLFPEPKISRRLHVLDAVNQDVETWAYIKGEFAGDVWAIAHSDASNDRVLIRDSRVILGLERKTVGGLTANVEVGYVFGRHIDFRSEIPDFDPADTILLRGGLMY
jgi:hypothetical protein